MLTSGGKTKMTRKMEAAIAALLTSPTIGEAAAAVGIHEQTLWRWLQDSDFQVHYREAKRQAVAQAVARLQQASGEAVETLRSVMTDPEAPASSKVTAAKTILEMAVKAVELEDLAGRIEAVEKAIEQRGQANV